MCCLCIGALSVCVCVCVCAGPGSIVGVCVVFPDKVMHFRLCLSVFRHSVAIISPYAHVVCVCVCVCEHCPNTGFMYYYAEARNVSDLGVYRVQFRLEIVRQCCRFGLI